MKLSKFFYTTLRETPSDATMPSHIFLMRGGYIKPLSTGIYSYLPMGFRVLKKIENLIREEMNAIDGLEVNLPVVQTAELWSESGRYTAIGEELLRFKDRNNHNMVLAMTHEEAITDLVRYVVSSYKQLPVMPRRSYPRPRIFDERCLQFPHFARRFGQALRTRIQSVSKYFPQSGN